MLFCIRARDGSLQYLLNNKQYTVGRKECDILIANDQSISRKHALLTVKLDKLSLSDCGSRYNTFINDKKLEPHVEVTVNSGDIIKFGMLESVYIFEQVNIVTTTSSIKSNEKIQLKNNITFLGGSLTQNWTPQCTHVTIEEIMLTVKVLCAIVSGIPIVKLKYWTDYVNQVKMNLPPPDVAKYRPGCSETILNQNMSLEFREERRTIFNNKIFVFVTKTEAAKMADMIELTGGEVISWDTNPFTTTDIDNSSKEYIMLQTGEFGDDKLDLGFLDIVGYINGLGQRTIPLQEIALAIINCSCEKDCNPKFDRRGTVLEVKTQTHTQKHNANVLVGETQSQNLLCMDTENIKSELVILHSLDNSSSSNMLSLGHAEKAQNSSKVVSPKVVESSQRETEISFKREGQSIDSSTAAKKFKTNSPLGFLKDTQKKNSKSSLTFNTASPTENDGKQSGKTLFAFKKSTKQNVNSDTENVVLNPFAKKRKAVQTSDDEKPSKKPPLTNSSLSSVPSTSRTAEVPKENIFSCTLRSKSSVASGVSKSSVSTVLCSTAINENPNSLQIDFSSIKPVNTSLDKSSGWIAKGNCNNMTVNGQSSQINRFMDDEDLLKYIESFKNTVVIEEEAMVVRKSTIIDNNNDSSMANGNVKNFKKFKKVKPLRPQTRIIAESSYLTVICNEKSANEVAREESESDDSDDNMDTQSEKCKCVPRRY